MGYVFDFKDAAAYEKRMSEAGFRAVMETESRLMLQMLTPAYGDSLLDIGCGIGASLQPFLGKGIQLSGIDPSPYMLEVAKDRLGHRVDLHRGVAEELPFGDNAFNYSVLFLTLEFVDNPVKALEEACRVTKDRLFIGIINRYSFYAAQRRIYGLFSASVYNHARFFSIGKVRRLLFRLLGEVPFYWRTVLHIPGITGGLWNRIEGAHIFEKSPLGGFAGIMAVPIPHYRTTPIPLKSNAVRSSPAGERVATCASDYKTEKQVTGKRNPGLEVNGVNSVAESNGG